MNTKNITTWIANHKIRTALIVLGCIILVWDWFAIPRLLLMIALPVFFLLLPLMVIAVPVIAVIIFLKRRARQAGPSPVASPEAMNPTTPPALPNQGQRRPTSEELMDMYERYPERFEGMDFGDDFPRY